MGCPCGDCDFPDNHDFLGFPRPLYHLEGFFVGKDRRVHVTFEDAETFVIDIFPWREDRDEDDDDEVIGKPIVINVRTGLAWLEGNETGRRVLRRLTRTRKSQDQARAIRSSRSSAPPGESSPTPWMSTGEERNTHRAGEPVAQ